jgi:hypothetical protein
VPVTLQATLSEVGTLDLVAVTPDGTDRFELELDMRGRSDIPPGDAVESEDAGVELGALASSLVGMNELPPSITEHSSGSSGTTSVGSPVATPIQTAEDAPGARLRARQGLGHLSRLLHPGVDEARHDASRPPSRC